MFRLIVVCVLSASFLFAGSPAEVAISKAQALIAKHPDHAAYYNALAMAYARRARETSDVSWYRQAEETLKKSLAVEPDNFEAGKVEAWLQLGRHEFAQALETARRLNKRTPDDVTVYGYLTDANVELGNYTDAVNAAQWMLDLKPGSIAGTTRAAYLRELHGNLPGALQMMQMAYDATPFSEAEDRAWLLTQMAHLYLLNKDLAQAETYAQGALGVFPGYHYALGTLAQVRMMQANPTAAIALLKQRYEQAPHAENLFALAEAMSLAGQTEPAAQAFAQFERESLAESTVADNSNHELIWYYVDHAHQPAKALEIARAELARRHDVFTRDGYAWALCVNGRYTEAEAELKPVLQMGVKDPRILYHASVIEEKLKQPQAAALLQEAAQRGSAQAQAALRNSPTTTAVAGY